MNVKLEKGISSTNTVHYIGMNEDLNMGTKYCILNILHLNCICLTSVTRAKCGIRSTLCWKIGNISGSTELFAL